MITVCQATLNDMDGVLALLKANHVSSMTEEEKKNGFVTTNMTVEQMTRLISDEDGVTVAKDGDRVVAFALAAFAAAHQIGVEPAKIAEAMGKFGGAGRRFEIHGTVGGVTIADDYAHHPEEITATLNAAQDMGFNKVWAVFQPFTYSRTKMLLDDFATSLQIADRVVMTEIMGSREVNTIGIYPKDLAEKIPGSVWFDTFDEVEEYVMSHAESGDLVITMGCGDVYKIAKSIVAKNK